MQRPGAVHHSALRVTLPTDLERIVPARISFEDKFYHSGPHQLPVEYLGRRYYSKPSTSSAKADQRRWYNRPGLGFLPFIVAICLAVALGGGLGGGLAAHRKPSPAKENSCTTGSMNNTLMQLPAYTTIPGGTTLLTSHTSASSTQTSFVACRSPGVDGAGYTATTLSGETALPTSPISASSTQTSFVACPSPVADGAVYTATNRPLPFLPGLQISNNSLAFLINCNTDWIPYSGDSVLQTQGNMNSLQECIDACATYTWLVSIESTDLQCSGVVWANGRVGNLNPSQNICFLKANLTQPCENVTSIHPGYDGAVLLNG